MRAVTAMVRARPVERLVPAGLLLLLGGVAARSVTTMDGRIPKPLVLVLVLCGASILLTISAEQLFLGWLFVAPLLQESATATRAGELLSLAFYAAPPVAFLVKSATTRGERPRRRWFDALPAAYLLFLVGSLVLTAAGELRTGTVGTLRHLYETVAIGVLVYYVVAFWPGRALGAVRIVRLLLLAAILQSAMAIVEWGNGWNLWHDTSWQQAGDVRAIGTLGNPALTGAFIGVGIVAALAILCWTGPAELHRLAAVMVIVGLPALYATKTRGPILATVVASLLCVVLSSRSRLAALGTVALVALVVVALWPEIRSSSVYRNRIDERQNVDARLVLQQVSITLAERRPLLGYGYDSFDRVKLTVPAASGAINPGTALQSTSHDTFLTMLVEFGAVGLILFVVPWLVVVGRAVRRALVPSPDRWLTVAAISGILVIAVTGATLDYRFFSFIPMLGWLLLGLLRRQIAAEA